jgi:hypothetical protein
MGRGTSRANEPIGAFLAAFFHDSFLTAFFAVDFRAAFFMAVFLAGFLAAAFFATDFFAAFFAVTLRAPFCQSGIRLMPEFQNAIGSMQITRRNPIKRTAIMARYAIMSFSPKAEAN